MVGDVKTEFLNESKLGQVLSPEIKAEVTSLVEAAMAELRSQLKHPIKSDSDSPSSRDSALNPAPGLPEMERQTLNDTIASLQSRLAATEQQVRDTRNLLNNSKLQFEAQQNVHSAQARRLEQRSLQFTEAEVSRKATYTQFRNERDAAARRERETVIAKDELQAQNALLSSQLSEMRDQLSLKVAQLNDTSYVRDQLEVRVLQLNRENEHWRQHHATNSPNVDPKQLGAPNSGHPLVYFSVPQNASSRRNTAPNILQTSPNGVQYPGANDQRPPKRTRVDSTGSTATISAHSRVSSSGSETFALRPVQPLPMVSNQQLPSPTKSVHATSPTTSVHAISPTTSALVSPTKAAHPSPLVGPVGTGGFTQFVSHRNPPPHVTVVPAPRPPHVPLAAAPSIAQPRPTERVLVKESIPVHVQQFLLQLFPPTASGHPECRFCKSRPEGIESVPLLGSSEMSELLAHAEKYHNKVLSLVKSKRQV